jgi:inorganic pyrophosphatase
MENVTLTKEQLIPMIQDIRKNMENNNFYKKGEDVKHIENAYFKVISICGEKYKTIQKTKILVVKYMNNDDELCSLNLSVLRVLKHNRELLKL